MPKVYSNKLGMLVIFGDNSVIPIGIKTLKCTQGELDAILPTDEKQYTYYVDISAEKIVRTEVGTKLSLVQRVETQENVNEKQDGNIKSCEHSILELTMQISLSSSSDSGTTPDTGGG